MLSLDHIIIPAISPELTAYEFAKRNDIHVMKGGHHDEWGTYNYLAYFKNNAYIEWIGIEQMGIAEQSDNPLIQQVVHAVKNNIEQPIQYALRTEKIEQYIEHFSVNNIPYKGAFKGSRERADGTRLKWQMLFPISTTPHPFPFLIQWGNEPNVQTDKEMINDRALASVTDHRSNIRSFKRTFHLPQQNSRKAILITNSQLSLHDGDGLTFTMK